MLIIKNILLNSTRYLKKYSETAKIDSEILLSFVLKKEREYFYCHPTNTIRKTQLKNFKKLIEKRKNKIPISYIINKKEFWSLSLKITNSVIVPRPETELLVETILKKITHSKKINFLDIGTGSGAIALSIAKEKPFWQIVATDISKNAVLLAKENAKNLRLKNIEFKISNWFQNLSEKKFDIIASNPPYISKNEYAKCSDDIKNEPIGALVAGNDGLEAFQKIIYNSKNFLRKNGFIFLEHGFSQAKKIKELLHSKNFNKIITKQDTSGHNRITFAKY